MKKIIFTISIISIFSQVMFSQSGWFRLNSQTQKNLQCVYFLDSLYGFAYGQVLLKTTNSGNNWIKTSDTTVNFNVKYICFINYLTGYIICDISERRLQKTTNGGINWTIVELGNQYYIPFQTVFIDQNTGFVSIANWIPPYPTFYIFRTTNGGNNWSSVVTLPTYPLSDILAINSDSLMFPCMNKVYVSTNRGLNWTTRILPVNEEFILFKSKNFLNIYCYSYSIPMYFYQSINNGFSWTLLYFNSGIKSGYFIDNTSIHLIAGSGIYRSTNSGQNWGLQGSFPNISDIYMINSSTGFIVGYEGIILKTTNGGNQIGIQPLSNDIPAKFKVSQNYPNPFNPTTKIKFDLPKSSFTKLVVYDLLGREVTTLVDEELKPGTYEAEWNASDISSGIYFYKLITDEFVEAKRMILIK
jgi:photosystem II stability/assembly factor-like uncharacterized protein